MKSAGMLPGRKTLIGGLGPLMLVLAVEILAVGNDDLAATLEAWRENMRREFIGDNGEGVEL